eukprot:scaffold6030_cov199-Amphora_coffeaeformis.AAC.9
MDRSQRSRQSKQWDATLIFPDDSVTNVMFRSFMARASSGTRLCRFKKLNNFVQGPVADSACSNKKSREEASVLAGLAEFSSESSTLRCKM